MIQRIKTDTAEIFIDESFILHIVMQKKAVIEDTMDNFILIRSLTGNQSLAKLIDLSRISKMHRKANIFLHKKEVQVKTKAGAFLVKNKVKKWAYNLFTKLSSNKVPVRMFTDYDQAITWLKTFNN